MSLNRTEKNRRRFLTWLSVFVLALACNVSTTLAADGDEDFNSPTPILISQADSTRALAVNSENYVGNLPKSDAETVFLPGKDARVTIFVTNLALQPGEGANAMRVYAEDGVYRKFRLEVENIEPLARRNWIYAVTVRLFDENEYNGQPQADGDVLLRLTWRGLTSNRVRLGLGKADGGLKDDEGAVPTPAPLNPPPANIIQSEKVKERNTAPNAVGLLYSGDRTRFMQQAAFGPNPDLNTKLRRLGIRIWLSQQFDTPFPSVAYPNFPLVSTTVQTGCPFVTTTPEYAACVRDQYNQYPNQTWLVKNALYGDNQLKLRAIWALHQIWVVSGVDTQQSRWEQEYVEILDKHAFGNYRNLMYDMTLNPAMGNYLDMVRSTRTSPNENYPREILQLFTTGLYELNEDGTQKLSNGNPIPTYDQDKVNQFTKVFTGWTTCENTALCPNRTTAGPNYIDPMLLASANHDLTAKTLFTYAGAPNSTIPACTTCTTDAARITYANNSLNQALDNIFYNPNVPPFVSRQLIQQFVTSDPTPAYVFRIAQVFKDNGQGVRGDLKAVIRAILLDPEARGDIKTDPNYGKLREPLLLATNLLRNFDPLSADRTQKSDGAINGQTTNMGQSLWNSPTVFNYYPPDYVVPGTDVNGPGICDFEYFNGFHPRQLRQYDGLRHDCLFGQSDLSIIRNCTARHVNQFGGTASVGGG